MALPFSRPLRFTSCRTYGGRCLCCVGRASSTVAVGEETVILQQLQLVEKIVAMRRRRHPCRDAEAVSHGPACLADHGDTPVALRQGDRRPCFEGCVSWWGPVHRHRARVDPAITAGKGWRGRRES